MAGRELNGRVEALESKLDPQYRGGVFIFAEDDETAEQAKARWIAENGPLDGRIPIIWIDTGVPRSAGESCV